jgi:hypothetical protein
VFTMMYQKQFIEGSKQLVHYNILKNTVIESTIIEIKVQGCRRKLILVRKCKERY